MKLGDRLQKLRKEAKLTQGQLAEKLNISMTQLVRYETKEVQPPANVLKKLGEVLGVSIDFLINGDTLEKAQSQLKDNDLLIQFKKIEKLEEEDKNIVKKLIDAFVAKKQIQQIVT
ncbi:MAG: helix-turn-helix domain-containing protein [Flavobacteriaceae bacterium]|nr:MAG: helix-turn-helix domain-containing protein [Flavobacteriaceae bacterium]